MAAREHLAQQFRFERQFLARFVAIVVGVHGLFIVATTLLAQLAVHRGSHFVSAITFDLPLLVGLGLLYLSSLLQRRKRMAWTVTIFAYFFYLGISTTGLSDDIAFHLSDGLEVVRTLVLPLVVLALLFVSQREFIVRSDSQGFRLAVRTSLLILLVAFFYGVSGFLLLDKSDFHQEISLQTAAHYTVDQFDLTTRHPLHPYTRRAHLFIDSLSVVSIAAVGYTVISLFQPLRARATNQTGNRQRLHALLLTYHSSSEDFFKLWPEDKQYFFDKTGESGLAFKVQNGVALCLADPAGQRQRFKSLLSEFRQACYGNDWVPALVHVDTTYRKTYEALGYTLQLLGQEAIIDLNRFEAQVARNKQFRHIRNKFTKDGYQTELLQPPHHAALIKRLTDISDEWLTQPGRVERSYVMGYFDEAYLQRCNLMILRDAAGTIQAFLNQVPADFDTEEATYDMLRQTGNAASNSLDFLLLNFIEELQQAGYQRLNLGLSPLAGLDAVADDRRSWLDNALHLVYANGDRFYSFSGLYRFKAKYEPEWRDKYIAYQGGVRGFTRTMNALTRAMRIKR